MHLGTERRGPSWIVALVVFVAMLLIIRLVQGPSQPALSQQFAAQPRAGDIDLPPVPSNLADLARTTTARILGGLASAPLDHSGQNEAIHVQIDQMTPQNGALRITGNVSNISAAPVQVSLDAFKFVDASNTVYAASGSPAVTLQPQQSAPLDLNLPIADPTQLTLDVEQPNTAPIRIVLIQPVASPTP